MDLLLIIKYTAIISFGTMFLIIISAFLFSRSKKNEIEEGTYNPQLVDNSIYYANQSAVLQEVQIRQYQNSNIQRTSYQIPMSFNSTQRNHFAYINRPVKQPKFVVIKEL